MRPIALLLPVSVVFLATACDNNSKTPDSPGDTAEYSPPVENMAPVATFKSHSDGDTERDGYSFTLEAQIADTDHDIADLAVSITADGADICDSMSVSDDGVVACEVTPTEGALNVTLTVTDPEGDFGEATVTITVNPTDAPVARIDLPTAENVRYYADIAVDVSAAISDTETAIADLQYTLTSDLDPDADFGVSIDADGNLTGAAELSEGLHTLTLTVIDETGKIGQDSVQFEVGANNIEPACAIVGPADGSATLSGAFTSLDADVSDPDVPADLIQVRWESDIDGVLSDGIASDASVTDFDVQLSDGVHQLTVIGVDENGLSCSASVSHIVGAAPLVSFDSPADGDILNELTEVVFAATVGDAETAADELSIVWTDAAGTVLSTEPADAAGLATYATSDLEPGDHAITVTATDSEGFSKSATITVTINAAPSAPVVSIAPVDPTTSSDLVVSIDTESVDPEGEAVSYTYTWSVDGVVSSASTTDTLPASATTRGEAWAVAVVPNDGRMNGDIGAASVTIANATPVADSVELTPVPASTSDDLTCLASGSDDDGDSLAWSYIWTVDGAPFPETSNTLGSAFFEKGQEVACSATPNDGIEDGVAMASSSTTIINSSPVISSVAVSPDPATSSSYLTCSISASDADGDSLSYMYAWTVNGVDIGVTTDTLPPDNFFRGDEVSCTAFVSDDGIDAESATSAAVTVGNSAPDMDSVTITPASATVSDDLTCAASATDVDGDSITYTYAWTVNGMAAGSSSTLSAGSFAKGDIVACQAFGSDGTDDGEPLESDELIISNSTPSVDAVSIVPGTARTSDTLTCSASTSDADGDSLTVDYSWEVNGSPVSTSNTLASSMFVKGDTVVCSVEASDGDNYSGFVPSADLVISNTKPAVSSVSLSPSAPSTADDITCNATGSDGDGDTVTFTYEWTVDGVVVAETGATLASTEFAKGQTVACKATPFDGDENGAWAATGGKTIGNSAPEVTSIAITPTTPANDDDLVCTVTGADADGDSISYTYSWTRNGANAGISSSTLTAFNTTRGDIFTCTATPTDGSSAGSSATSAPATITNQAPIISSVTLSTASPATNDTLTANVVASDADGDSYTVSYEWFVNGASVQSGPSNSFSGALHFDKGETVYVVATASDASDSSIPTQSNVATVANTPPGAPVVVIDPEGAEDADDLVCTIDSVSSDADGDPVSYTFTWERDGVEWTGAVSDGTYVGDTISNVDTAENETWTCFATPNDGTDNGTVSTDDETILPSTVVWDIGVADGVNLMDVGCGDERTNNMSDDWGFFWDDSSGRTPMALTIDFDLGFRAATGSMDVSLNGVVIDTITIATTQGMGCTMDPADTESFTLTPVDLSAYDPEGTNELTIVPSIWAGFYPDLSGNIATVTIDY